MNCHPYHHLSRKILNIMYIDIFELLSELLGMEHFKIIYQILCLIANTNLCHRVLSFQTKKTTFLTN